MSDPLDGLMEREALPAAFRDTVERVVRPLTARIVRERLELARPIVLGLCGSQGSGKSTVALFLAELLGADGLSTAVLSLDDLYLTHEARQRLARERHPLLATRGVPGTHDVALGVKVLSELAAPAPPHTFALPRFDKATDTRATRVAWPTVTAPVDVVVFEGWLVGARPQPAADLDEPLNALERDEDPGGVWRRDANTALAAAYQALFAKIDLLVLLQPPGFEQVHAWRALQEAKLAARLTGENRAGGAMDEAALARFIQHYERLTRWILKEMPTRADVVVRLGREHEVLSVTGLDGFDGPLPEPTAHCSGGEVFR